MKKVFNHLFFYLNLGASNFLFYLYGDSRVPVERHGNEEASWWIPSHLLTKDWVIYSGGVGNDISFELALISTYTARVHTFDPTPQALKYLKTLQLPSLLSFHPWGLWSKNKMLKFFSPANQDDVSHSIVNLRGTDTFFTAKCKTIKKSMFDLGHSHLDLLKVDIEGAEYEVLFSLLKDQIYPQVVCVEFDQPTTVKKMSSMYATLYQHGYRPIKQDYFNVTFIRT